MATMDLFKAITKRFSLTNKVLTNSDLFGAGYQSSIDYLSNLTSPSEQLNYYFGWVYACIQAQAEQTAEISFNLFKNRSALNTRSLSGKSTEQLLRTKQLNTDDLRQVDDHPSLTMLACPNDIQTKTDFIELIVTHLRLTGNAYSLIMRDGLDTPSEVYPLNPANVQVISNNLGMPVAYEIGLGNQRLKLQPEDVIHFRLTHPTKFYSGVGVVEASMKVLKLDQFASDYNLNFAENATLISGNLQIPGKSDGFDGVDKDVKAHLKKIWLKKYAGVENAGKLAILDNDITFQPNNLKKFNMLSVPEKELNKEQILAMLKTSASILGIEKNSNRSVAEASQYNYSKGVINTNMRKVTDTLNNQLMPQYDTGLILTYDSPIPADKAFELKKRIAYLNRLLTVDEVRKLEGYPELPDGRGQELYQPSGDVPLGYLADLDPKPPAPEGDEDDT